ncbi:MAG: bifunctional DNA-formamidopyrimidine glycosylase/DNA-(apurinic or apyrimidinic site) lyase [Caldilineaceae bacterium]
MPELPEVETYVRELEPALQGRTVVSAVVSWPRIIAAPAADAFAARIVGQQFVHFGRRGKYMLVGMTQAGVAGDTLIVHLRMTGRLIVYDSPTEANKHTHVVLGLADGGQLHYQDSRKFGRLWLVTDPATVVAKLGPEPLQSTFTPAILQEKLKGRSAAIKALLLDQSIVAGVGNIYADESLFRAGVHPTRAGGELTAAEVTRIAEAIRTVLTQAIDQKGSSLGDSGLQNYLRPSGELGGYQQAHAVFQRTGQPCLTCGHLIERIVVAQRSTHFCPHCQA